MNYKVVCLADHPDFLEDCAKLLNTQWPRSLNSRLRSLEQGNHKCGSFPTSLLLIQENDDNSTSVIGHSKILPVPHSNDACFVESVVIDKSLRKRGLGRIIMEATEKFVKEKGIKVIHLTTHDQQEFYLKLGYQLSEPIVIYGGISSSLQKLIETHSKHDDMNINSRPVIAHQTNSSQEKAAASSLSPTPPPLPNIVPINNNLLEKKVYMIKYL